MTQGDVLSNVLRSKGSRSFEQADKVRVLQHVSWKEPGLSLAGEHRDATA